MRSLFILLVALNIGYLIWGMAFSEKNLAEAPQTLTQGLQTLTLLSEKPEDGVRREDIDLSSKRKIKITKSDSDTALSRSCYSLGPFFEDEQVKKLEEKLQKGGFSPVQKSITDKEPKSYWVYLSAAKNLQTAKVTADDLRQANVKDYFIIRKGKNANAISLGLYNSYSRAKLRRGKLTKLGFKPKMKTRYKEVTRHWLDFQDDQSKRLKDNIWKSYDKDIVLQKILRPCVGPLPEFS